MKVIITTILLVLNGLAFSQNDSLFEEGNKFYNEGNYPEAIKKYESVLKTNEHSAALYFNLANAHYKLSNIAPSVYYYEKALQLKPKDKDILNNRQFAKNMTVDAIPVIPEVGLSKYVNKAAKALTLDSWAKLAVALVIIFVVLVLLYYFSMTTNRKRISFIGSIVALFLAIFSLSFAFHNYNLQQQNNPAIVFAQEAEIKSEPNLRSSKAFVLHEGTKVQIIDTVNNWKEIKLTDGKTGWIISDDLKLLNDI